MKSELLLLLTSRYSLALTSISFKDFPFLYETIGGSLNISLSSGWFWIKCHLLIKMFLRLGVPGVACVIDETKPRYRISLEARWRGRLLLVFRSFILGWRFIFLRGCFPLRRLVLSIWLWLRFLLECPSYCLRWPLTSSPSEFSIESSAVSSWSNSFAGSPVFFSLRFSAWVQSSLMVVNILKQGCSFGTKAFLASCYCSEFLVERTLWAFRGTTGFYCLNTRG